MSCAMRVIFIANLKKQAIINKKFMILSSRGNFPFLIKQFSWVHLRVILIA